jgi:choline dehydrogenase-like flavoprotein
VRLEETRLIIDYRNDSCPADIEADICIIGAGAAGLAIARTFLGSAVSVCVIESGGLSGEERNQALYDGSSVGKPEFDPSISRMRVFGGTCNLWGGGCIPLGELHPREWVPHSGWPLSYEDLKPHYANARAFCRIESHEFVADSFLTRPSYPPLAFDNGAVVNKIFAFSPILFGNAYRGELEQATNIRVLLHANLLELDAASSGDSVQQARIGSLEGRRGTVRAKHYVLACGGIENARLLLLSNSVVPQGLGNQRDLVGRYFMDHPSGKLGTIHTDDPSRLARLARPYDRNIDKGTVSSFPEICLSEEAQRAHRILSGRVRPFAIEGPVPKGIRALRELKSTLRARKVDESDTLASRLSARKNGEPQSAVRAAAAGKDGIVRQAMRVGLGIGDIARAFGRKLAKKPTVKADHVALVGYFEQEPNPDSRITLGDERDALGQQKVCVDWRLTPLDHHTYRTAAMLFGTELAGKCNGRFQLEPWLEQDGEAVPQVYGTSHHLGTTRMADDPGQGVVDRECKVHGIDNLYVAGSSVFPTGGWAFPTFTIVALSLRLAEHLRSRLELASLVTPFIV